MLTQYFGEIIGHAMKIAAPAIANAILTELDKRIASTVETVAPQPELKKRLLAKLPPKISPPQIGLPKLILISAAILPLFLAACATRTIHVPHGEPVQLARTIPKAHVWLHTQDGKTTPARIDLPEGWYCLPDTR